MLFRQGCKGSPRWDNKCSKEYDGENSVMRPGEGVWFGVSNLNCGLYIALALRAIVEGNIFIFIHFKLYSMIEI